MTGIESACVCVCVCTCLRSCVRACVRAPVPCESACAVRLIASLSDLPPLTYDPGYDEDLHPGEGGGLHAEQLGGVVLGGHVGQQRRALEAVGGVHHQQEQEHHEGRGVGHELQEGPPHHPAQLERGKGEARNVVLR